MEFFHYAIKFESPKVDKKRKWTEILPSIWIMVQDYIPLPGCWHRFSCLSWWVSVAKLAEFNWSILRTSHKGFVVLCLSAKRNPSYSSDLHFLGLHYRPDRVVLICLKYVPKSSKTSKKVDNALCPIKKADNDAICPINGRSDQKCHHRSDNCITIPRKCMSEH